MTSNAIDPDFEPERRPVRIDGPGDLLASVPALLGFPPARSVVVACLTGPGGRALGTVMRHDFVPPPEGEAVAPELLAAFVQFTRVCVQERAAAATVMIIDDAGHPAAVYTAALDILAGVLADRFVPLAGAHFVARLDAGEPWWSLLDGSSRGRLPDPGTSGLALAHILEGRQIHAARENLEVRLERGDPTARAAVARWLGPPVPAPEDVDDAATRAGLRRILAVIRRLANGATPTPAEIAHLGRVVDTDLRVRDVLLGLAAGPYAGAAEEFWLTATRLLPDPQRAAAATLLGFSAYVRGDGPFAGMCLSAALESDPTYRLAVLLDASLTSGLRPARLERLIDSAREVAATLQIDLPSQPSRP